MTPMRLSFTFFLFVLPLLSMAAPYTAFRDGESFTYRAGWGIFPRAGEIKITARYETADGRPAVRIVMHTSTHGIVRGLYTYDDVAEALIDVETGRLLRATDVAENGEKLADEQLVLELDMYEPLEAIVTMFRAIQDGQEALNNNDPGTASALRVRAGPATPAAARTATARDCLAAARRPTA